MKTFTLRRAEPLDVDDNTRAYMYDGFFGLCASFVQRHLKELPDTITVTVSSKRFKGCSQMRIKCSPQKYVTWTYNTSGKHPRGEVFPAARDILVEEFGQNFNTILYYKICRLTN